MTHTTSLASNSESRICRSMETSMASERTFHRAFVGISASLFATSAAVTIVWCVVTGIEIGYMRRDIEPAMGSRPLAARSLPLCGNLHARGESPAPKSAFADNSGPPAAIIELAIAFSSQADSGGYDR